MNNSTYNSECTKDFLSKLNKAAGNNEFASFVRYIQNYYDNNSNNSNPFFNIVYDLVNNYVTGTGTSEDEVVQPNNEGNKNKMSPEKGTQTNVPDTSNTKLRDLRISKISLEGVRKYPFNGKYSLSLLRDGQEEPSSGIFVGANGCGKSTLFDAIEYYATGSVSEAELRGGGSTDIGNYLLREGKKEGKKEGNIIIKTVDELGNRQVTINSKKPLSEELKVSLKSFFFCEKSLIDTGRVRFENPSHVLMHCVKYNGLEDITELIKKFQFFFKQFESYCKEKGIRDLIKKISDTLPVNTIKTLNDFGENIAESKLEEDGAKINGILATIVGNIGGDDEKLSNLGVSLKKHHDILREKIEILVQCKDCDNDLIINGSPAEIDRTSEQDNFDKEKEIQNKITEIKGVVQTIILLLNEFVNIPPFEYDNEFRKERYWVRSEENFKKLEELNNQVKIALDKVQESLTKAGRDFYDSYGDTIKEIMEMFMDEGVGKFVMKWREGGFLDKDDELGGILIRIDVGGGNLVAPNRYFNTFRYKLFCMTLQLCIAFSLKKDKRFNFPIVFDDVFNASDYRHLGAIANYFSKIAQMHNKIFGVKQKLQIIGFTHDELVLSSFSRLKEASFHYPRRGNINIYELINKIPNYCKLMFLRSKPDSQDETKKALQIDVMNDFKESISVFKDLILGRLLNNDEIDKYVELRNWQQKKQKFSQTKPPEISKTMVEDYIDVQKAKKLIEPKIQLQDDEKSVYYALNR